MRSVRPVVLVLLKPVLYVRVACELAQHVEDLGRLRHDLAGIGNRVTDHRILEVFNRLVVSGAEHPAQRELQEVQPRDDGCVVPPRPVHVLKGNLPDPLAEDVKVGFQRITNGGHVCRQRGSDQRSPDDPHRVPPCVNIVVVFTAPEPVLLCERSGNAAFEDGRLRLDGFPQKHNRRHVVIAVDHDPTLRHVLVDASALDRVPCVVGAHQVLDGIQLILCHLARLQLLENDRDRRRLRDRGHHREERVSSGADFFRLRNVVVHVAEEFRRLGLPGAGLAPYLQKGERLPVVANRLAQECRHEPAHDLAHCLGLVDAEQAIEEFTHLRRVVHLRGVEQVRLERAVRNVHTPERVGVAVRVQASHFGCKDQVDLIFILGAGGPHDINPFAGSDDHRRACLFSFSSHSVD